MTTKTKMARFIREAQPLERPAMRPGPHKPSGLYLLALRSHAAHTETFLSRRKLVIRVESHPGDNGQAESVNINHA